MRRGYIKIEDREYAHTSLTISASLAIRKIIKAEIGKDTGLY